jgi:hypothetical protein
MCPEVAFIAMIIRDEAATARIRPPGHAPAPMNERLLLAGEHLTHIHRRDHLYGEGADSSRKWHV